MDETRYYWGKACRHGHVNEEGKSRRSIATDKCYECDRAYQYKFRKESPKYKEYQKAYHAKLRKERPEKLIEYYNNLIEHGSRPGAKKRGTPPKENQDMTHEQIIAYTHNKSATMLYNNMKSKYFAETGELTALALQEGYKTVDEAEAALMLKARLLVDPSFKQSDK